jgi:hypothetical protein
MKSANPEFRLDEGALTFWADELITSAHAAEAIEVLKLDVEMHQETGAAYSRSLTAWKVCIYNQTSGARLYGRTSS